MTCSKIHHLLFSLHN